MPSKVSPYSNVVNTASHQRMFSWQLCLAVCGSVAAIFGLSRILSANPIAIYREQIRPCDTPLSCNTPSALLPYFGNDRVLTPAIETQPQERLSMRPGYLNLEDGPDLGHTGYVIREQDRDLQLRDSEKVNQVERVYQNLKMNDPQLLKRFDKEMQIEFSRMGRYNPFSIGGGDGVLVSVNPHQMANQAKADAHMRTWMEEIPSLSPQEIVENLVRSHALLFKGASPEVRGLRNRVIGVFSERLVDRTLDGITHFMKERGTSKEDLKILKEKIFPKFVKAGTENFPRRSDFTKNELRIVERFVHLTPDASAVPELLLEFAKELKESYLKMVSCSQFDPVAFSSWAHRRLGEIHPFEDGSGRTSRLLLNNILKLAGHAPVVFPNEDGYIEATIEDQKKPGHFAAYLREAIIPWNQRQFGPGQLCLRRVNC